MYYRDSYIMWMAFGSLITESKSPHKQLNVFKTESWNDNNNGYSKTCNLKYSH